MIYYFLVEGHVGGGQIFFGRHRPHRLYLFSHVYPLTTTNIEVKEASQSLPGQDE
ncbi:hypothetical protein KDAU_33150 [Dictyobacter aurantiacus]|uniref:Uncharacterized protein n=1 Tax=Dictyobacter aurantiacus TaxID=1936993 RepID=A0A401ZGL5_9CHLR|nr:hypothetical protein KDAU_33150 [Dictyobacter aurantiacus]